MEPAHKKKSKMARLESVEDMAKARFGNADGLAIVRETTLGLARHYAERLNLTQRTLRFL